MGLDISAYKGIKKINAKLNDDGYAVDSETNEELADGNWFSVWLNPNFPGRADDIEDNAIYSFEDSTCHGVGYGGHFWWRNELAKLAGYPLAEIDIGYRKETTHFGGALRTQSGPFYELINFSDAEGVIGTNVSKKLSADFLKFESKANELGDERFITLYQCWKSAFEMAAESGCVCFH